MPVAGARRHRTVRRELTARWPRPRAGGTASPAGPRGTATSTPARLPGVAGPRRLPLGARAAGPGLAARPARRPAGPTSCTPPRCCAAPPTRSAPGGHRARRRAVDPSGDADPARRPLAPGDGPPRRRRPTRWSCPRGRRPASCTRQLPAAPLHVVGEGVAPAIATLRRRRASGPAGSACPTGTRSVSARSNRARAWTCVGALADPALARPAVLVVGPSGWGGVRRRRGAGARLLGRLGDRTWPSSSPRDGAAGAERAGRLRTAGRRGDVARCAGVVSRRTGAASRSAAERRVAVRAGIRRRWRRRSARLVADEGLRRRLAAAGRPARPTSRGPRPPESCGSSTRPEPVDRTARRRTPRQAAQLESRGYAERYRGGAHPL